LPGGKTLACSAAGQRENYREAPTGAFTLANRDFVDRPDRGDLNGGPGEEDFIGEIKHLPRNDGLLHGNLEILGELDDRVACNTWQDAGGQWGCDQPAVMDKEDVHSGAFAHLAIAVERDAFSEPVERRFHADQLRVHVVGRGLRHGRQRVRRNACPGTDANVHPLRQSVRAEICAPLPAGHIEFDRRTQWIHTDFAVTAKGDWLHVARAHFVHANQFAGNVAEVIETVGKLHPVNSSGIDEPLHVFTQAEDRRP